MENKKIINTKTSQKKLSREEMHKLLSDNLDKVGKACLEVSKRVNPLIQPVDFEEELVIEFSKMEKLEEYKTQVANYLKEKMNYSEQEIKDYFETYETVFLENMKEGTSVRSMAAMIYNEM